MNTDTRMEYFRKQEAYAAKRIKDALAKGCYKVEISDEMIKSKLVKLRDGRTYLPRADEETLQNTFWRIIVCGLEFTIEFHFGAISYGNPVRRGRPGGEFNTCFFTGDLYDEFHKLPEFRVPKHLQYATLGDVEFRDERKCERLCDLILDGKFSMQRGDGNARPRTITVGGLSFVKRSVDSEWEQLNPEAYDFGDCTPLLLQVVFDDALSRDLAG